MRQMKLYHIWYQTEQLKITKKGVCTMKNEKLIPSLFVEDKSDLPKRGGRYVSKAEKEKKEKEAMRKKIAECNCNCNCNCNCDDCDNHPFFGGEGSCG